MALIRHATLFSFLLSNLVLFGPVGAEWSSSWLKLRSLLAATDVEQQGLDDGSFLVTNNQVARDFGDFADEDEDEYFGGGDVGRGVFVNNHQETEAEADQSPKWRTEVRQLKKGRNKVKAPVVPRAPVAGRRPKVPKAPKHRARELKKKGGGGGKNKVIAPTVPRAPVAGRRPKAPKAPKHRARNLEEELIQE